MARKRSSPLPAIPRRVPAAKPSVAGATPTRAHARLVHGFLVRVARPTPAVAAARANPPVADTKRAFGRRPFVAKHEGPPDDATFH